MGLGCVLWPLGEEPPFMKMCEVDSPSGERGRDPKQWTELQLEDWIGRPRKATLRAKGSGRNSEEKAS